MAGCAAQAGAAGIEVATAYVPVPETPGTTVAYVVIRNNGAADRLVAARTSAGGHVLFQAAAGLTARTLRSVPVPAHGMLAMAPDGVHMVLTGVGPLRSGKDLTLTLVFAHAGAVPVVAQVTNPATGGASYLSN
ncbi:MAG TPA: copper chaperone PCu(A)C [Streptosporangiaceae bacterium]|nr:copper chaperone PCu(A)C [Streptosporangiaceae bacterium]